MPQGASISPYLAFYPPSSLTFRMHKFKFVPPPDTPSEQTASRYCPTSVRSCLKGFSLQHSTDCSFQVLGTSTWLHPRIPPTPRCHSNSWKRLPFKISLLSAFMTPAASDFFQYLQLSIFKLLFTHLCIQRTCVPARALLNLSSSLISSLPALWRTCTYRTTDAVLV